MPTAMAESSDESVQSKKGSSVSPDLDPVPEKQTLNLLPRLFWIAAFATMTNKPSLRQHPFPASASCHLEV